MGLRYGRTLLLAVAVEAATILTLVILVAVLGPAEPSAAQEYAARLGRWVGPVGGFVFCLVGGWLVARGAVAGHVVHGLALGIAVAALDVLLLVASGSGFEWLFVLSNGGRIVAGALGGALRGRNPS